MAEKKNLYASAHNPLLIRPTRPLPDAVAVIGAGTIGPDIGYYLKSAMPWCKLVLVDIAEQSDEEAVAFIHNARIELYWSYLPAILLLPEGHPELEEKLKADGAVSEMITKPVEVSHLFERIKSYTMGDTS